MTDIRLVALDLDGTLFNNQSKISDKNRAALQAATGRGIHIVISTGRPYSGLPLEQLAGTGIRYAITTNGAAIYEIPTRTCIYEDAMVPSLALPVIRYLLTKDIHMDAFIDGNAYSPLSCLPAAQKLNMPPSIKKYILETRTRLDDFTGYIEESGRSIQKMTLNFYPDESGTLVDRENVKDYLMSIPDIECVSGGYNNLEFTKRGIDKGIGLKKLAGYLGISPDETLAIGDSGNDASIIQAAGIGIAMGNATEDIKAIADDITLSIEEDGVAAALYKYLNLP